MKKDQYENEKLTGKKRHHKKRGKIVQGIMIVILCIITFLGGRASAEADQDRDLQPPQEPDSLISDLSVEETAPPGLLGKDTEIKEDRKEGDSENVDQWNLILVNKDHPLPNDFSVDLVRLKNGHSIDERAYADLQAMMDDARAVGLAPLICSSYRTMEKQTSLYNKQVEKYQTQGYSTEEAKAEAGKWVAVPGTSEHQAGLAVDIVSESYQSLDKQQESTAEQLWLMENCYKYGFILRYQADKSDVTGIGYEPWHYRYVGKEAAAEIMKKGICLEEYLND